MALMLNLKYYEGSQPNKKRKPTKSATPDSLKEQRAFYETQREVQRKFQTGLFQCVLIFYEYQWIQYTYIPFDAVV